MVNLSERIGEAIMNLMYDFFEFIIDNPYYVPIIIILIILIDIKNKNND